MATNGDVIQVDGDPGIFFVESGYRRHVPNMESFWGYDFDPNRVKHISRAEMDGIPLGRPLEPYYRYEFNVRDFLGSGHYMTTVGTFSAGTGQLRASTITQSVTWLGGFTGGVSVVGLDMSPSKVPLFASPVHTFGVDGTLVGRSRREDVWADYIDWELARRVGDIRIVHGWYPKALAETLRRAVETLTPLTKLVTALGNVGRISNQSAISGR